MAVHEIRVDRSRPLGAEPGSGHNRWHPDVPPIVACRPGDDGILDTRDAVDGQIGPNSTADDVASHDSTLVHPLTGPIAVEGAEPGDLLVVDVLEVTPRPFGYTMIVPGFGFLRDEYPDPFLIRWEIEGPTAVSSDLPGVRVPGAPFLGTVGVAPSRGLLERIADREAALHQRGGTVALPTAAGAVPAGGRVAEEGLRTFPPRENAGNVDIKHLTAGARLLLPVWVPGALLSVGDAHFAQGDGESCGTAIEMSATVRLRVDVRTGAASHRGVAGLQFELPSQGTRVPGPRFATTGVPVRTDGSNESEDLTLAARSALRAMIDHLVAEYGFSRQQAYALSSVAVDLSVSEVVNAPNFLVSAFLPLGIFETSGP